MKKKNLLFVFVLALSFGFFACEKSSFDEPVTGPSTMGVQIQALNTSYSLPVNSQTKSAFNVTSELEWDSVHLFVSQVKLGANLKSMVTRKDSIEIDYKWTGQQLTDLLNPSYSFGNFVLQPGFYDEIEMSVSGFKKDADTIPVFYMHGTYTNDAATSIQVKVLVFEDIEFKTEKDSVIVTEESYDFMSNIQIYLDELLAEISPSMFDNAKLVDGIIVISAKYNKDIYWTVMKNLVKKQYCEYKYKKKNEHKWKKNHHDD